MGYRPPRPVLPVELPIAVPVITAGLRVAVVANVSLVAVAGTIGQDNLGRLFTQGFQALPDTPYYPPIVLGIVLCVLLALVFDALIAAGQPAAHPLATGGAGAMIGDVFNWLTDPAHWRGTNFDTGIRTSSWPTSRYSRDRAGHRAGHRAAARARGSATPAGRPGSVSAANALRALPTVGVLVLLVVIIAPHFYGADQQGLPDPDRDRARAAGRAADPVQHLRRGAERRAGGARRGVRAWG